MTYLRRTAISRSSSDASGGDGEWGRVRASSCEMAGFITDAIGMLMGILLRTENRRALTTKISCADNARHGRFNLEGVHGVGWSPDGDRLLSYSGDFNSAIQFQV